jgi:hypothetical protein
LTTFDSLDDQSSLVFQLLTNLKDTFEEIKEKNSFKHQKQTSSVNDEYSILNQIFNTYKSLTFDKSYRNNTSLPSKMLKLDIYLFTFNCEIDMNKIQKFVYDNSIENSGLIVSCY